MKRDGKYLHSDGSFQDYPQVNWDSYDKLYYWFFAELDTCEDTPDLNLLYQTFSRNLRLIEEGQKPEQLIRDYRDWFARGLVHFNDVPDLLRSTGMYFDA